MNVLVTSLTCCVKTGDFLDSLKKENKGLWFGRACPVLSFGKTCVFSVGPRSLPEFLCSKKDHVRAGAVVCPVDLWCCELKKT